MKKFAVTSFIVVVFSLVTVSMANAVSYEHGFDRTGGEYLGHFAGTSSYQSCAQTCTKNSACVAFTWVKPGIQGPVGVCWLKGSLSAKVANDCCVSGVVRVVREDQCKWHQRGTTYVCYCQSGTSGKWFTTNPSACKDPKPNPRYIDNRRSSCPPGQVWVDSNQVFGQGRGYCKPK